LNNADQYSRRDCLEIRGIPLRKDEETNDLINKIGELIDVEIVDDDISISHRLASNLSKHTGSSSGSHVPYDPAIIVKFVRREVRYDFYQARKNLRDKSIRDIGFTRISDRKIYIAESLTQQNRKLFNQSLELKKKLKFKCIWTSAGRILFRKDGSSPVINISSWKDLDKFKNDFDL
jgi:hypothetical protein